jgi:hypothetical protein
MNILLAELAAERLARGRRSCSSFTFRGTPITVVEVGSAPGTEPKFWR